MDQQLERLLHEIYMISGWEDGFNFDRDVTQILYIVREYLGMEVAIVSHISDENYRVLAVDSVADIDITKHQNFQLCDTYCSKAILSTTPVLVPNVAESEFSTHPAFESTKLYSYTGITLMVEGQPFGTLNFSSRIPREYFSDIEVFLIQLTAIIISSKLHLR